MSGAPARRRVVRRLPAYAAPAPLSDEERALLQVAASHPEVLREAAAWRRSSDGLLQVAPVRIEPLPQPNSMED
jgi:hypothetical protein